MTPATPTSNAGRLRCKHCGDAYPAYYVEAGACLDCRLARNPPPRGLEHEHHTPSEADSGQSPPRTATIAPKVTVGATPRPPPARRPNRRTSAPTPR